MKQYLESATYIDSDHQAVIEYAHRWKGTNPDPVETAITLYLHIRDTILYDAYVFAFKPEIMKASYATTTQATFCIPKAVLLAACARVVGIPSRLGFADVRNHLAPKALLDLIGTDVFYFHGYTELHLNGSWVKATPAFNLAMCERFGVKPLEFNGIDDSIFHPYDRQGRQHMEYIVDHGVFADLPFDLMQQVITDGYPHLFDGDATRPFFAPARSANA